MAAESDVLCEIEVLQSIYLDDLTVTQNNGGWRVSVILYPSTGEDCLAQFVRLTLTLDLDSEANLGMGFFESILFWAQMAVCAHYPTSPPHISIHHPRGLSDDKLLSLQSSLHSEAQECVGTPVLYQLIEKAKEILTHSNIPHGNCVICLYGFKEGEVFTKTSCYHYFHSHCLGRYITHSEEELQERVRELQKDKTRDREEDEELCVVCPVCREPLLYDLSTLLASPVPNFPQEDEAVTAEFRQKWVELQKVLERQREKGGIIDPEAESNRFLIHVNHTPVDSSDLACTNAPDPDSAQPLSTPFPPDCTNQNRPHPRVESMSCPSHRRAPHAPHSRRHPGMFRGGRRDRGRGGGRGGYATHAAPAPVLENLAKLSMSPAKSSRNSGAPQETSDQRDGQLVELNEQPRQTSGDESMTTNHQEIQKSRDDQHVVPHNTETGVRERGARQEREKGRRHGPRGPPYSHWHERNPQRDNGDYVHHHHHRGTRGHRLGHHKGNTKSWHQQSESELLKEGVL